MAEAGRGDGLVGRIVLAFLAGLGVGGSLLMDVSLLPVLLETSPVGSGG